MSHVPGHFGPGLPGLLAGGGQAQEPEPEPAGFIDRLARVISGPPLAGLDPAQEKQARDSALLQASLALLAGSRGPTLPGIAQALLVGQQTGTATRADIRRQSTMQQITAGGVDQDVLQELFVQSIAAGDIQSARALAEVIKSIQQPVGATRTVETTDEEGRPITAMVDAQGRTIREFRRAPKRVRVDRGATIEVRNADTGEVLEVINKTPSPSTVIREGQQEVTNTVALVRDFRTSIEPYREFSESFARVKGAVADPNAPNDISLLTSFMKMVDEGSVVREAEFRVAQSAATWFDRARVQFGRAAGRTDFLTPETRQEFLAAAQGFADVSARTAASITRGFSELFTDFDLRVPSLIQDPFVRQGIVEGAGGIDLTVFDEPEENQ